jgi:O-antigen/teichoic acid export membrane protein
MKLLPLFVKIKFLLNELINGQKRTAKASRQIVYSFVIQGISIIISFLNVPLLLSYFPQEKYGIWLTLLSILGWFSFFDIGLGHGMRNKLAETFALNNVSLGKKYVSTTYAILICIFGILLIAFHIINSFIDWNLILNTHSVPKQELYLLTSFVFSFMCINFVVQLIGTVYNADQKPSVNSAVNALAGLFALILVYILVKINAVGNLVLFGSIVSSLPVLLYSILTFYSYNKRYFKIKPAFSSIDLKYGRNLMTLGGKFFLMQITSLIMFSTSNFFISHFFGPSDVVVYNITFKYFQIPTMVFAIILTPLWSAVTDAYAKSDFHWLRITIKRLNVLSTFFALGILIMLILSDFFFEIWIGNKVQIPLGLKILMAAYFIMNVFIAPYSYFINGTGKIKLSSLLSFAGMTLFISSVFVFSNIIQNSSALVLANIITLMIGGIIQPVQTYKILHKNDSGIWSK